MCRFVLKYRRKIKKIFCSVSLKTILVTSLLLAVASCILYYSNTKVLIKNDIGSDPSSLSDRMNVTNLTRTLKQMMNESTDMTRPNFTRPCTNLWLACTQENCSRKLSTNSEERVWDLLSPKFRLSQKDRDDVRSVSRDIPVNDVIFVAAASSNHFDETQAMIHSLHTVVYPRVKNMSIVLFDIGLTAKERQLAEKGCQCHVITFPFNEFPEFFRERGCYTWKPLIVLAAMMKARRLVVYQDASIRWKEPVLELLDRGDKLGVQLYGAQSMHNIPVATLKGMFDYFGDQPCAYLPYTQVQSGIGVFKNSPFIVQTILEPWAKCAFEKDCICPKTTPANINCGKPKTELHMCHSCCISFITRYDQSALSMIVTKLFAAERYRYHMSFTEGEDGKYISIQRGHRKSNYFSQVMNEKNTQT